MTKILKAIPWDPVKAFVKLDNVQVVGYGPDLKYKESKNKIMLYLGYSSATLDIVLNNENKIWTMLISDSIKGERQFKVTLEEWEYIASSEYPVVSLVFQKESKPSGM